MVIMGERREKGKSQNFVGGEEFGSEVKVADADESVVFGKKSQGLFYG